MISKKIFTVVSPKSDSPMTHGMCYSLPIELQLLNTVEELFPMLSDCRFHTDFVCISIDMFSQRRDQLTMFDIIHTLATLIKSTVYRDSTAARPKRRDTKICVLVDATTDPKLVREVMQFPDIAFVGWILKHSDDYQSVFEHVSELLDDKISHHPRVVDLVKPKKQTQKKKDTIDLTLRQAQILQLIQDRGATNKTIARMLNIGESTVKLHVGAIFKKYGVRNRTQLAIFAA